MDLMNMRCSFDSDGGYPSDIVERLLAGVLPDVKPILDNLDSLLYLANNINTLVDASNGRIKFTFPTTEPETPGTLWSNGGIVCVTPGLPNSYTNSVDVSNLPTELPAVPGILWLNGGVLCVS
jgi:hypothetical protein